MMRGGGVSDPGMHWRLTLLLIGYLLLYHFLCDAKHSWQSLLLLKLSLIKALLSRVTSGDLGCTIPYSFEINAGYKTLDNSRIEIWILQHLFPSGLGVKLTLVTGYVLQRLPRGPDTTYPKTAHLKPHNVSHVRK